MEKKLKSWQGWLLFGGSMVVVFVLGLCVSALMERRAEVTSIFNNRKTVINPRITINNYFSFFHFSFPFSIFYRTYHWQLLTNTLQFKRQKNTFAYRTPINKSNHTCYVLCLVFYTGRFANQFKVIL